MSAMSTDFVLLQNTPDNVFTKSPPILVVNEEARSKYADGYKIDALMQELRENGPMIALGPFGPSAYKEPPFKVPGKLCGMDVYAWKSDQRLSRSRQQPIMILGVIKTEKVQCIYFTMSIDTTQNTKSYIRTHIASSIDQKIYVMSHETFKNYVFDIYPPNSASMVDTPKARYIKQLTDLPLDSILDQGEGQKRCKEIGQKIFDEFKKECGGQTQGGMRAVQKICKAIRTAAPDGRLRSGYIERAWHLIGDENWFWMA